MKKNIYAIIMVLAIIFAIGTEGACIVSTISFGQAVLQEAIAVLCAYVCYRLHRLEEYRESHKVVH